MFKRFRNFFSKNENFHTLYLELEKARDEQSFSHEQLMEQSKNMRAILVQSNPSNRFLKVKP